MFLTSSQELAVFFAAQAIAVLMCVIYDALKVLKPQKASKPAADFYDLLCWVLLTFIFCAAWQKFLYGMMRWYILLGLAVSAILYFLTIHKPIFTAYCIIKKKTLSFLSIFFKFLLTVWAFLVKITVYVSMVCKKMYIVDCEGKKL